MTDILLFRLGDGRLCGFSSQGHAGTKGSRKADIVCSAVSALTQTAVNAIERIAGVHTQPKLGDGMLTMVLPHGLDLRERDVCDIILRTMETGLIDIESSYPGFIRVACKEMEEPPCLS